MRKYTENPKTNQDIPKILILNVVKGSVPWFQQDSLPFLLKMHQTFRWSCAETHSLGFFLLNLVTLWFGRGGRREETVYALSTSENGMGTEYAEFEGGVFAAFRTVPL